LDFSSTYYIIQLRFANKQSEIILIYFDRKRDLDKGIILNRLYEIWRICGGPKIVPYIDNVTTNQTKMFKLQLK